MKITVLGKYGPFPKAPDGATSGYLFEENGVKIALDMGSGVLSRLQSACDINTLDAIFVSHLHFDHTSDLLPLGYLLDTLGKKMKILTHREDSEWYKILFNRNNFEIIDIDENKELNFNGLKLNFYKMKHPVNDYAIKISGEKTFLYTGDTVLFPEFFDIAKGTDVILANCTKPHEFKGPHMTVENAVEIQEKTGATVLASHFAPSDKPSFSGNGKIIAVNEGESYIF